MNSLDDMRQPPNEIDGDNSNPRREGLPMIEELVQREDNTPPRRKTT